MSEWVQRLSGRRNKCHSNQRVDSILILPTVDRRYCNALGAKPEKKKCKAEIRQSVRLTQWTHKRILESKKKLGDRFLAMMENAPIQFLNTFIMHFLHCQFEKKTCPRGQVEFVYRIKSQKQAETHVQANHSIEYDMHVRSNKAFNRIEYAVYARASKTRFFIKEITDIRTIPNYVLMPFIEVFSDAHKRGISVFHHEHPNRKYDQLLVRVKICCL